MNWQDLKEKMKENKKKVIAAAVALLALIIIIILLLVSCTDKTGPSKETNGNPATENNIGNDDDGEKKDDGKDDDKDDGKDDGKDDSKDDGKDDANEDVDDEEGGLQVVEPGDEEVKDESTDISDFFDDIVETKPADTDCVGKKHSIKHVKAVKATETKEGNIEYWYCKDCDEYYADAECTEIIVGGKKATILPVIKKEDNKEEIQVNKEEITIEEEKTDCVSKKHNVQHVEAKKATKKEDGNIEYWYCEDCDKYYADAACTKVIKDGKKATVIPALGEDNDGEFDVIIDKEETDCVSKKHDVQHVEAVAPTETREGNIEYWYCKDCDEYYADKKCTEVIVGGKDATVIPATGEQDKDEDIEIEEEKTDCISKEHDVQHVEAKKATKEEEGNIEYWYCKDCDKYYKDAACTQVIVNGKEDTILPKLPDEVQEDTPGFGRFY